MRYIGSKSSTVKYVYELISERIPSGSICDPFGGIGIIGAYFKAKGYHVWCGDALTFAHYFQIARIERNRIPSFKKLRRALNLNSVDDVVKTLRMGKPKDGWFVREYCKNRCFFTKKNATHINTCRLRINEWCKNNLLSSSEQAVLLASLINSMDKVANTAGTYYAYLKTWYRKSLRPFRFELLPCTHGNTKCQSFLGEARDLVAKLKFDILYLDPPYNQRCYSRYYHLPETIATGKAPRVYGKSGMPHSTHIDSDFNKSGQAKKALEELLANASFRLLAFHYSDDGLITPEEVRAILTQYGSLNEFVLNSIGYTTESISRNTIHRLYLVNHD